MGSKEFAAGYPRDEHGWLLFPLDKDLRSEYFIHWRDFGLPADHPAKANLHLTRELIRYTTEPGQRVMDIMAGAGSVLIGLADGRKVTALDVNPSFVSWMRASLNGGPEHPESYGIVLEGDCRELLPLPADAIVFSPPYSQALGDTGSGIMRRDRESGVRRGGLSGKAVDMYNEGKGNLSQLPDFLYNRAMQRVYELCWESLPTEGKLSLLIKDRIRKGERIQLGFRAVQMMGKAGFRVHLWERWKPPGSMFVNIRRSQGIEVVEDEHIIIMEKVER